MPMAISSYSLASVDEEFLREFKTRTERHWSHNDPNPTIYGFQFQRDTKWNPGLDEEQVREYEARVQAHFPIDFRRMLLFMNGTDKPTLNVYGMSGVPFKESVGVYSYPRDIETILDMMKRIKDTQHQLHKVLAEEMILLNHDSVWVPIYAHRFIVCNGDKHESKVLSIMGLDAILYASSLREYLELEFRT
jgi:hypothetical protein